MSIDGGLKQLLRKHIPTFDWQGIETGGTGRGIPDMNYCHHGVEGWIECKATDGWVVDLRPEQVAWMMRRHRAGGRVWILVRQRGAARGDAKARDVLWLAPGSRAIDCRTLPRLFPDDTTEQTPWVLRCERGPSSWNWDLITKLLTTIPAAP